METSKPALFAAMQERMRFLGERQHVLSKNIANANTPKYKAQDLNAPDFNALVSQQSSGVHIAKTNDGHMHIPGMSSRFELIKDSGGYETAPDGNNVVLEEQMMKVAETTMDYQTTASLYNKMAAMMKAALGKQ